MLTAPKILLVILPLLVVLCLVPSYSILYASPDAFSPAGANNNININNNKIWPTPAGSPSSQGQGAGERPPQGLPTPNLRDLRALCSRTPWNPDLAVHCHSRCGRNETSFCGGLNNARDRLQTCLRLAVDAGATEVLIPTLTARSRRRLAEINPAALAAPAQDEIVDLCADAWFDVARLQTAFQDHCPQTRVRMVCVGGGGGADDDDDDDVTAAQMVGADHVVKVPWRSLGEGGTKYDARTGHSFREAVGRVLLINGSPGGSQGAMDGVSKTPNNNNKKATLVEVGDTYMAWDYKRSGEQTTLFKDLFQAVAFNPALRALGQRIVTQHPRLRDEPYIGVHLRGENDWPAEWGSLEDQIRLYTGDIETMRLRDETRDDGGGASSSLAPAAAAAAVAAPPAPVRNVYVSCGNRTAIAYFRARLEPLGYAVFDKWTLLLETGDPEDLLAQVEALSFDEKAVVEYEPLVQSRYFLGISYSSMSYVIATARTLEEPGDFMDVYVFGEGSKKEEEKGINEVKGNEHTRLIYVNID